jgi:hypothetical protein
MPGVVAHKKRQQGLWFPTVQQEQQGAGAGLARNNSSSTRRAAVALYDRRQISIYCQA